MNQDDIKINLLKVALQVVPFEGWSHKALCNINKAAGYHPQTDQLFFSGGAVEMIGFFHQQLDHSMVDYIKANPQNGVRKSLAQALYFRFEFYQKNRAFMSKTFHHLCLPQNIIAAQKMTCRTMDLIWHYAGRDQSTDFNYYTKRGLLFMVYNSAFLYWLADNSLNCIDTKDFIMRRLDNTVQIGSKIGKLMNKFKMGSA